MPLTLIIPYDFGMSNVPSLRYLIIYDISQLRINIASSCHEGLARAQRYSVIAFWIIIANIS